MNAKITFENIQGVIEETVESLPQEFKDALENVDILIEYWPTEDDLNSIRTHPGSVLFGLYRGVPKTKRANYSGALPDKIVIFAGPIISVYKTKEEIKKQIEKTVLHEIGHHFGMSEESIREAQKE